MILEKSGDKIWTSVFDFFNKHKKSRLDKELIYNLNKHFVHLKIWTFVFKFFNKHKKCR